MKDRKNLVEALVTGALGLSLLLTVAVSFSTGWRHDLSMGVAYASGMVMAGFVYACDRSYRRGVRRPALMLAAFLLIWFGVRGGEGSLLSFWACVSADPEHLRMLKRMLLWSELRYQLLLCGHLAMFLFGLFLTFRTFPRFGASSIPQNRLSSNKQKPIKGNMF